METNGIVAELDPAFQKYSNNPEEIHEIGWSRLDHPISYSEATEGIGVEII
jgi:hypothetical protein